MFNLGKNIKHSVYGSVWFSVRDSVSSSVREALND